MNDISALIPENQRSKALFEFWSSIFQYAEEKFFRQYEQQLRAMYNPQKPDFKVSNILRLVGDNSYLRTDGMDDDQLKTLALLVGQMDMRKGTRAALQYVLRYVNFDVEYYEWFQVQKGAPYFYGLTTDVEPCDLLVVINLGLAPKNKPVVDDFDAQFAELVSRALMVCVRLKLSFRLRFDDFVVPSTDSVKHCKFSYFYEDASILALLPRYLCPTAPSWYRVRFYGTPSERGPIEGILKSPLEDNPPCDPLSYDREVFPFDHAGGYGFFFGPDKLSDESDNPNVLIYGYSVLRKDLQALIQEILLGNVLCTLSTFLLTDENTRRDRLTVTLESDEQVVSPSSVSNCWSVGGQFFFNPVGLISLAPAQVSLAVDPAPVVMGDDPRLKYGERYSDVGAVSPLMPLSQDVLYSWNRFSGNSFYVGGSGDSNWNFLGVFPTARSHSGVVLAGGSLDPHWRVVANSLSIPEYNGPCFVSSESVNTIVSPYPGRDGSNYIRPQGSYDFETSFIVPVGTDPQSVVLTFKGTVDDTADIYVNGVLAVSGGFVLGETSTVVLSSVNSAFVTGINTVVFRVTNIPSGETPSRLTIEEVTSTVKPVVYCTNNTAYPSGLLSPSVSSRFMGRVSLSSFASDDDLIGVVLAYRRIDSVSHYLAAVRTNEGISPRWGIVEYVGSVGTILVNGASKFSPGMLNPLNGWLQSGVTALSFLRDGNHIEVQASAFGSREMQYSSQLKFDISEESVFYNQPCYWGFMAYSQDRSMFSDILTLELGS